jgi:hypothetical protein
MSEIPAASELADRDEARGLPHSCYLLEFSVSPGGARLGDVFVGRTLDELRQSLQRRWHGEYVDGYLVIWYGAVLHLWVVQEGSIVEGIDLHPYLRTGDDRCDRAFARVIAGRDAAVNTILDGYVFDTVLAIPLLTRVFELQDRIAADADDAGARAELDRILEAAGDGQAPTSYDGVTVEGLGLDWDALATAVQPLREPILAGEWVGVRWADPALRHPESHLHVYTDPAEHEDLHLGLNDLENGDDEIDATP